MRPALLAALLELAAVEDAERRAEFSEAFTRLRKLSVAQPGLRGTLGLSESMGRLRQRRLDAGEAAFAIDKLLSESERERAIARRELIRAGDIGTLVLRRAVRGDGDERAAVCLTLLRETAPEQALVAAAERMAAHPDTGLRAECAAAIEGAAVPPTQRRAP